MSHLVPTPTFTIKFLLRGGKSLEESLAIVRRAADELNMRVGLPTADEVHAYLEHRHHVLRNVALMCAVTKPDFIMEPPPSGTPSMAVCIAEFILELQHDIN